MRGALNVAIFTPKEAAEVLIGRERASAQERQMYAEALQSSDAGTIELSRGEKASRIKRLLRKARRIRASHRELLRGLARIYGLPVPVLLDRMARGAL